MVRKLLISLILVFVFASQVSAQPATNTSPLLKSPRALTATQPAQPIREAIQNRMQEFKERISQISDAQKQAVVERIVNNLTNANSRLTNTMNQSLQRMISILGVLSERSERLKAAGTDTTALDNAIVNAGSAIEEAQTAVDAQAAKEYTANITSDTTLRTTIGQMVSQFRQDIQSVHQLVVAAKQAVSRAVAEAAKLGGNNTATSSATL